MPKREGQVQVTMWLEPEERDAFKKLCSLNESSVSGILKDFMGRSIQRQSIAYEHTSEGHTGSPKSTPDGMSYEQVKSITKRLTDVEMKVPSFDVQDLKGMKDEVLDGDKDSMKYRLSELEWKMEKLIAGSLVYGVEN